MSSFLLVIAILSGSINIYFVTPPEEAVSEQERDRSIESVQRAVQWWKDLSPIPIEVSVIASTVEITVESDIFLRLWDPRIERIVEGNYLSGDFTIIVIDNSKSGRLLLGDSKAVAIENWNEILVTTNSIDGPVIAHELGHILFELPDLYEPEIDIMYDYYTAFITRQIGCTSRGNMGHPCSRIYLPAIYRHP